jgi:hypothetical protein
MRCGAIHAVMPHRNGLQAKKEIDFVSHKQAETICLCQILSSLTASSVVSVVLIHFAGLKRH